MIEDPDIQLFKEHHLMHCTTHARIKGYMRRTIKNYMRGWR